LISSLENGSRANARRSFAAAVVSAAALACLGGSPARAEQATIEVRVDAGGAQVAGALVRVRSPAFAAERTARLGEAAERGVVVIDAASGLQRVSVELAGFQVANLDLELAPRETLRLTARLRPGASTLEIAERFVSGLGSSFAETELLRFPSGRDPWALLETGDAAAILDRMDGGGLYSGEAGRLGLHGAPWAQVQYRLGDLDITDPLRGGAPLLQLPLEALGALDLASGGAPRAAGVSGPVVALTPRRAARSWSATAQAFATTRGLQAEERAQAPPSLSRYSSWGDGSVVAGGPIAGERLSLLAAGRVTRSQRLERHDSTRLRSEVRSGLLHAAFLPAAHQELRLLGAWQSIARPAAGRARFDSLAVREDARVLHAQATWDRDAGGGRRLRVSTGFLSHSLAPPPEPAGSPAVDRLAEGPLLELFTPETRLRRVAAAFAIAPAGGALETHAWTFGGEVERDALDVARREAPPLPEAVSGLPARVWEVRYAGESRWRGWRAAGYASDRVRLGDRFTAQASARVETQSAETATGASVLWLDVSPSFDARLTPPFLPLSLLLGVRLDHPRLPLSYLGFGDAAALQGGVFRWTDRNGDGRFQDGERGALVSRVGWGGEIGSVDRKLAAPRAFEATAGFETSRRSAWGVRLVGIYRRVTKLVESVNVGVPRSSYRVRLVPDPSVDIVGAADDRLLEVFDRDPASFGRDRYFLTNPGDHVVKHQGIELHVARSGERLRLRLGATASRTSGAGANRGFLASENDPGLVGELYDHPHADSFRTGRMFFDRAYTIKAAMLFRPARELWLSALARYQDGQPFARVVIARELAQGPDAVPAVRRGDHRFTYTLTVDARVEKVFSIGRPRLSAVLEAFNVLDQRNEVEEDVVWGPGFRRVTATQPPRALRLGIGLAF
jgi:hypothetical protein